MCGRPEELLKHEEQEPAKEDGGTSVPGGGRHTSRNAGEHRSSEDKQFTSTSESPAFAPNILQGIRTEKDTDLYHLIIT